MKIENGKIVSWEFYQKHIHRDVNPDLIPTAEDLDETKFPAIDKILNQIVKFRGAMKAANIPLIKKGPSAPQNSVYLLTDSEFQEPYPVNITLSSNLLDEDEHCSLLWTKIFLRIYRPFHYTGEFCDNLVVGIKRLDLYPFTWGSRWNCFRWDRNKDSLFDGTIIEEGESPTFGLDQSLNFKTTHFNTAVDYFCSATDKIISRASYLVTAEQPEKAQAV